MLQVYIKHLILFLSLVFLLASPAMTQDTIILLSGEKVLVKSFQINEKENIISFVNKRGKDKYIELDYIFCVRQASGEEVLIYSDSVFEDDSITVNEMRDFVYGAITANETYKPYFEIATGFVVGAGSVFLFPQVGIPPFYAPIVPAAYSAVIGSMSPKEKCVIKRRPEAEGRPYYIKGYTEACQQKRVTGVVQGSIAGIVAIIVTALIVH
jgi:hypothetical protein